MSVTLHPSELKTWRKAQRLSQGEMARLLGTAREWLNKIERERADVSADIQLKFEALKRDHQFTVHTANEHAPQENFQVKPHLKSGDSELRVEAAATQNTRGVASRFAEKRTPSNRNDVEEYFRKYLDAAQAAASRDEDPDIFPAIMRKVKSQFRVEEFDPPPSAP